jgi:hypothetical protein
MCGVQLQAPPPGRAMPMPMSDDLRRAGEEQATPSRIRNRIMIRNRIHRNEARRIRLIYTGIGIVA